MEVIIVNNKGRCSRCCHSEIKQLKKNFMPLLEDDNFFEIKEWQYCKKYDKFCKGLAGHCKAPQDGYHE